MSEFVLLLPREAKVSPLHAFFKFARHALDMDELGLEIVQIAFPAALALTADPLASLIDTAFIGQIGSVELAAVGVSIAIFTQVSKVAIFPLVSVTTSFVAEEDAACRMTTEEPEKGDSGSISIRDDMKLVSHGASDKTWNGLSFWTGVRVKMDKFERKHIPSVSLALLTSGILGLLQAIIFILGANPILNFMGLTHDSPMLTPARQYLRLRSIGAPAVLLSLAMQGIFRGFKDTKTPFYATVAGDATNIILDPILMFVFHLGISGAALAHAISQYLTASIMLWRLIGKVDLLPPSIKTLQFHRFLKMGLFLLVRGIALTCCMTLATSMAAQQGSIPMAAFQICLQIWLATSLLADGLAIAGQAILASAFARGDYYKASAAASRVLQLGVILGLFLAVILGVCLQFISRLFTEDGLVLQFIQTGIPFVAGTQPINALAFVFDGINYGASDFAYSAYSMFLVAMVSALCLVILATSHGFVGIWIALTIYMSLRMVAGFWRIGSTWGPWSSLRV
ncbi:protein DETOXIFICATION 42-like [Dioscorea cayenensis subsp. rotundata]|uniref:Protein DETOXIFICATION n=1 Tax=Dioscorea cayennensis subsp. rotundata TaxID=55577 RepID=A0AB40BT19_DIOCR|nr:protein DETOXIFICATION 42-like [Dioscorea cayenensis subsp. rotundata]XP_039130573.1 protein DETOXIFICATION 42-like [Dioscorea cayenensis subsp. rotundata]XP_039130574.1 protein DETOXIFICATION 42-like [Dioscorea cayenensis subsp. rotundata]XP_039130575.1 protein DETOXIFICATION 42-like [Dioscorea cayenensis subsp. rotundata]XP_039130576.1 protein DETOXIFICATION 42-like [Dioscorea cayenensis subsp. rotundata]XP_039130577.1 protein DETOXIFICATION 42-like [Dioscorea cayenensis subsp. rotundata]